MSRTWSRNWMPQAPAQYLVMPPQFGVVADGARALLVTGRSQSLPGGVCLEAVRQLMRTAQRGGMPAVDLVGDDAQPLQATRRRKPGGNRRSSRQIRIRVGTPGQARSGDGSSSRAPTGRVSAFAPRRPAPAAHPGKQGDVIVVPTPAHNDLSPTAVRHYRPHRIRRHGGAATGPRPCAALSRKPEHCRPRRTLRRVRVPSPV